MSDEMTTPAVLDAGRTGKAIPDHRIKEIYETATRVKGETWVQESLVDNEDVEGLRLLKENPPRTFGFTVARTLGHGNFSDAICGLAGYLDRRSDG